MPNLYSLLEETHDCWHVGKQHLLTEETSDACPATGTKWTGLHRDYCNFLEKAGQSAPGGWPYRAYMPSMDGGRTRVATYSIPTTGRYDAGGEYTFDGFATQAALKAIRERAPSRPFFLSLMYLAPHPPFEIPDPWFSRFAAGEVTLPDNIGRWSPDQSPLQLYNLPGYLGSRYRREDWLEVWRVYLGLVAFLDHCVGQVIAELERVGLYDDALIVFTADHGEMLGSHCLWQKMCMYEESARVPLAIKAPHQRSRGVCSVPVSHVDVLPTVCDELGIPTPEVSGVSLRTAFADEFQRDDVFIQFDGTVGLGNLQRCLVRDQFKLIVDTFKDETYLELYDVLNDPQEHANLIWAAPDLAREMLDRLEAHMRLNGDTFDIDVDAYSNFVHSRPEPQGNSSVYRP